MKCDYVYTNGYDVCCRIYGILGDIMGYSGDKCKKCSYRKGVDKMIMKYDISKCILALIKYCNESDCSNCKLSDICEDLYTAPCDINTTMLPKIGEATVDIEF